MLLCTFLNTWLNLYVVPAVRPSTAAMYRRSVEALPAALGDLQVETIGPADLLALRAWQIQRAAFAPRAAQLDRVMITRALAKAQALGIAPQSLRITEALPQIRHEAAKAAILDPEQLRRYIDLAPIYGGEEAALLLLCCCGLRRGEALGARWEDLHGDVLQINGSRDPRGTYGPPKTAHGIRAIVLPSFVLDQIHAVPRSLRVPWIVDTTASRLQRAHKRVLAGADLTATQVTIHGLRHSLATLAANSGESMKLLQLALGHSKVALTADLYADHINTPSACVVRAWNSFNIGRRSGARLEIV